MSSREQRGSGAWGLYLCYIFVIVLIAIPIGGLIGLWIMGRWDWHDCLGWAIIMFVFGTICWPFLYSTIINGNPDLI
jgi:hypothetical protein